MVSTEVRHCTALTDVDWPDDAVFIVDSALPDRLRERLPEPKLEIDGGEPLKTLNRAGELAESVLAIRSTRPLTIVAVGGGAVGDAVGFVASILWRGVDLWHVPTTLLAMVDSAHGGKTAVNLAGRKNQLGTFYPAKSVVICTEFLQTLPRDLREEGFVELLKALWLARPDALEMLDDPEEYQRLLTGDVDRHQRQWRHLLTTSVEAKNEVVAEDPKEQTGHRRILNLGHTAGHGLEALYRLPHGRAIGWGLAACALLSHRHAGLTETQRDRMLAHLDPLLVPLPEFPDAADRDRFIDYLGRDKKRADGELISILLDAPGSPVQTREITPEDWWDAVLEVFDRWRHRPLILFSPGGKWPEPQAEVDGGDRALINLPTSKSHANRAAVIAHLRDGSTELVEPRAVPPADVVDLRRALQRLDAIEDNEPVELHTGNGGTTARFLLAVAANRPGPTTLTMSEALRARPHGPLVQALRAGGADIEETTDGFEVRGWSTLPDQLTVDASNSSQFASAVALLSASGDPLELQFTGDIASRPYFEMTLKLLADAGVDHRWSDDETVHLEPTDALEQSHAFELPPDASSAVVWQALSVLDDRIEPPEVATAGHPDRRFMQLVERLSPHRSSEGKMNRSEATLDLSNSPDLGPVLAALACRLSPKLTVTGAAHLRHKESNRIDELAAAFAEVGVDVEPTDDGFVIPAGVQTPQANSTFDPRGDHRLAMAAMVLGFHAGPLTIDDARCTIKSYPDLWRQARRAGWTTV